MKIDFLKTNLAVAATSILLAIATTGVAQAQNRGNDRADRGNDRGSDRGSSGSRSTSRESGSQTRSGQDRGSQSASQNRSGQDRNFQNRGDQNRGSQNTTVQQTGQYRIDRGSQPRNTGPGDSRVFQQRRDDVNRDRDRDNRNQNGFDARRQEEFRREQERNRAQDFGRGDFRRDDFARRAEFRDRILRYDRDRLFYDRLQEGRYRVYRSGGSFYETDRYGVSFLRQATSLGYEEGVRAGQNDRRYGRGLNYQGLDEYRSGAYGYQDGYVESSLYQYYFQQGFQRGYEDGFYGNWRYGSYNGGTFTILGSIVDSIISFRRY